MSLEIKLISILVFLLAIGSGGLYLHHKGYVEAETEYKQKIHDADIAAKTKLDILNAQVLKNQTDLTTAQQAIIDNSKELENAKQENSTLHNQLAAGTVRLSVRANRQSSPAKQDSSTITATGISQDAQLVPDAAAALADLARGYNENMRMKNECIDLYNSLRDKVNN